MKNVITLIIISVAAAIIYQVPYLKSVFYDALQEALGVTHTELGSLSSIYGTVAMISYIPGGIVADKIRMKYLFSGSMVACGLLIFWYATIPSLLMLCVIHFLLGIFSILTFWSVRLKIVRFLSNEKTYPKNQGISNAFYGLTALGASFIAMFIIERSVNNVNGLKGALLFYAIAHVLLGVLSYFVIPKFDDELNPGSRLNIREFIAAIKIPSVWLVSISVFMIYTIFTAISYTTPYFTNIYLAPVALVTAVSIIRSYGVNILAAPTLGFLSQKVGSIGKLLMVFSGCVAVLTAAFFLIPVDASLALPVIVLSIVCAFFANGMHALSVTQLGEVGVPKSIFGSASGITSMIGYLPDVFIYVLIGSWLDNHPGTGGYYRIFAMIILAAVVNLFLCAMVVCRGKSLQSQQQPVQQEGGPVR